jgi:hypothetical protein
MSDDRQASPVEVEIKNWADHPAKPRLIKHSTFNTYIIDATNATNNPKFMQIAAYEPHRLRCHIVVTDSPVAILNAQPKNSPDPSNGPAVAPEGAYVSPNSLGRDFFGPDPLWINSLSGAAAGRVTVIKEYC